MATDSIITLERLRCIRESDGTGHSEPYLWPAVLWVDDHTLTTPELVGVTAPALGNARIVIRNDMRAGQTADIPASVGVHRVRFEDGLTIRRLLIVVALWEEDETPEAAMRAGFQAFSSELRAAVGNADTLFALNQATGDEREALIEGIKTRIKNKVASAIRNGLTAWQKARVFAGTLNLDDIINSEFRDLSDLGGASTAFTLAFQSGTSDNYEIQGRLQLRPVRVDRCQAQVNAVQAALAGVRDVDGAIKALQAELQKASPAEKPFIIAEIRRLREEDLPAANAAVEEARAALERCRARTLPVVDNPGGVLTRS